MVRYFYTIATDKDRKQIYNIYYEEDGQDWIFDPILRWSKTDSPLGNPRESKDSEMSPYFDELSDLLDYVMKNHADYKYDYDVLFIEYL